MSFEFKADFPRSTPAFSTLLRLGCIGAVALIFTSVTSAEQKEWTRPPPAFRQTAPLESVRQAAAAAHFPLEGLALPAERTALLPGDSVTALLTLTEGQELKQWIVVLEAVEPNEKEKKVPLRTARLFTSSGYEFRFGSEHAVLEIKMVGPLASADAGRKTATAPDVKRKRVGVSAIISGSVWTGCRRRWNACA